MLDLRLDRCLDLARTIVWDAVGVLLDFYQGRGNLEVQNAAEGPVTAADLTVNHQVVSHLQAAFPDPAFGYLSEENDKYALRPDPLSQPWIWVLDPIDGTRDFIERTGQFTLHLALLHQQRPVLALLAVPIEGILYTAIRGQGTFVEYGTPRQGTLSREPVRVSSRYQMADLRLVIGRNRNYPRFAELLEAFPVKQHIWGGGLGFKMVQILQQSGEVYLSLSGTSAPKDWDLAAPDLALTEAGGKLSREDGLNLRYNQGDPSQWGCLIGSNGTCHATLCQSVTSILNQWSGF
jgi:3'(2'), 5'-bisphosphate nucleotidase